MVEEPAQAVTVPAANAQWLDVDGRAVHYVDYGGAGPDPALVLVHGLGGSLVNWSALAPLLAGHRRVLALDLPGFGLSQGAGRSTAVHANRDVVSGFLAQVCAGPAVLVGNSMGGMIAAMQAVSEPATVAGVVLIDPVLPVNALSRLDPLVVTVFAAYAVPPLGRALRLRYRKARTAEEVAAEMLRLCCGDPSLVEPEVVQRHIDLAVERQAYPAADAEFIVAARSLLAVLARRRAYADLLGRVEQPVLLLHGDRDRLVPLRAARAAAKANPRWQFHVAEGAGHIPQLEVPGWVAARIVDWLGS